MPKTEARVTEPDERRDRVPMLLQWTIVALVLYRVLYHLMYVGEVPFAAAPISDGYVYEQAARDIIAHPPWGKEAFWLQGVYSYLLAVSMAIGGLGVALLVQLLLAGVAFLALHAACRALFGARAAAITIAMALAVPALAFYENKFLSAELAILAESLVIFGYARAERGKGWAARLGCGAAVGLAVLARPNLLLIVPTTAWALLRSAPDGAKRGRSMLWFALGIALALTPMAVRNAVVTGEASVFPVHGGGTSFYIGNNAAARGVWNTVDGMLSGDVAHEVEELGSDDVGTQIGRERAIGREMYERGLADIRADPGRWLVLELRKLWLIVGNDELAQDYDRLGERELLPWFWQHGLPFGVVLALAVLGVGAVRRGEHGGARLWLLAGLAAATVIANLVFFTSSQHRLPLFIPLLVLAGPGVRAIGEAIAKRGRGIGRGDKIAAALACVIALQALVPRLRTHEPSAVHYYNLALAWDRIGEQRRALDALDRALIQRPEHPVMRLERAMLRRQLGYKDAARADLAELATLPDAPAWVRHRAASELATLQPLPPAAPPQ